MTKDLPKENKNKKFNWHKLLKVLAGVGVSVGLVGAGFGLNFAIRPEKQEDGTEKTVRNPDDEAVLYCQGPAS